MNPRQMKLNIKGTIIGVLKRDGKADREVLKSSLKLETGFKDAVIDEIIEDLYKVGTINIVSGVITLSESDRKAETGK